MQRFSTQIKRNSPTTLWYILTKLKSSALWGLEAARSAINHTKLSKFNGNVFADLGNIDQHFKTLQQYEGQEEEMWLCGAIFQGLSDTTNITWMSIITSLKKDRKSNTDQCDSSWLISQVEELYRGMQAEHGFDTAGTHNSTASIKALSAITDSIYKLRAEIHQHKKHGNGNKNYDKTANKNGTK